MKKYNTLIFITALIFLNCKSKKETNSSIPTSEVATPILRTITEWDEFTGRFQAIERVEVRARVGGYVAQVNFTDGQMVKEGELLFTIDQRPFKIELEDAQAAYERAKAELIQAQGNFNRVKDLRESGAVSIEEYSRREQLVFSGEARLKNAQAAVNRANLNLQFTQVRSPINGRVGRDLVTKGNLISGGSENATLLTTVVSISPIHFYFQGSEADLLRYTRLRQSGDRPSSREEPNPVLARLQDETEYVHRGRMDFVDNELSRSTGTIEGRAIFDNDDDLLEPGMFGRIRLIASTPHDAMLIPDYLVQTNQTIKFVYTLNEDNIVEATNVELGNTYARHYRIVESGLEENQRLVLENLQRIRVGDSIKVMEKTLEFEGEEPNLEFAKNKKTPTTK